MFKVYVGTRNGCTFVYMCYTALTCTNLYSRKGQKMKNKKMANYLKIEKYQKDW